MKDKDFDGWNNEKKKIDKDLSKKHLWVNKREIRLYYVWVNVWNEISKNSPYIRPCLVINNYFIGDLIVIIPITTKYKPKFENVFYKLPIKSNISSFLMLNQITVISKKRLVRKIYIENKKISTIIFEEIINKMKNLL